MDQKLLIFTNRQTAFITDHGRQLRKGAIKFISRESDLFGLNTKTTIIIKRIYPCKSTPREERELQEIQDIIERREFNVIEF